MPRLAAIALAAVLVLATVTGIAVATGQPARIEAVVANPIAPGDHGEYVVLDLRGVTAPRDVTLTDGETTVRIPAAGPGRIAVSTHPGDVVAPEGLAVVALQGRFALANDGETITLRVAGRVVDTVTYDRAPEAEILERGPSGWRWRPLGVTERPVVTAADAPVTAFVLPDDPALPVAVLDAAQDRVFLAAYTLRSRRVVDALCGARGRGAIVRVLAEATPVGGRTQRGAAALDALAACDVTVRVIGTRHARYAFMHAKYAVVDDRAVVLTENWVPNGVGGRSSRGWGIVVDSPRVAAALADTHDADTAWRDVEPWTTYRAGRTFTDASVPTNASYPSRFASTTGTASRVGVIVAPDNAEAAVIDRLAGASTSIDIQQLSIGGEGTPFLRAAVAAARRGVRVRVLLSGASYVRDHNAALAATLNERARRDGLPLEVRVSEPRSRFGKIHTKGVVIDGETVILGSLNWNNHSARQNREVALVVEGDPATFYARVFAADWRGGRWRLPMGLAGAVAVAGCSSALLGRRLARFR